MTERTANDWHHPTRLEPLPHPAPFWKRPAALLVLAVGMIAAAAAGYFVLGGGDDPAPAVDGRSVIDEADGAQFIGL